MQLILGSSSGPCRWADTDRVEPYVTVILIREEAPHRLEQKVNHFLPFPLMQTALDMPGFQWDRH